MLVIGEPLDKGFGVRAMLKGKLLVLILLRLKLDGSGL